jgi:hypothetical protein
VLRARRFHRDEAGQAIFVVATTLLGMLFMVGLAMDAGQLYNGRRTAQEAADSAAFAGAVVLYQSGTTAEATSAATNDASINGYATDTPTTGTTVTPQVVTFNGNTNCVEVNISTPVRTSILPRAQFNTVQAHATACSQARSTGYAVMATDQTCTTSDLRLQSQGNLTVHGGSIQVNSCGSPAASIAGGTPGAVVSVDAGYKFDIVGTVQCSGTCPGGGVPPSTNPGAAVQPDPFSGAPKPSTSGMSTYLPQCAPTINQPGIYTSDANTNCTYYFAPGTYVWKRAAPSWSGNAYGCTGNPVATTATLSVAIGTATITPASMTNIGVNKALVVDTGASQELVTPNAVTATTFTAKFTKAHVGTWSITGGCSGVTTGDGGVFFFITTDIYPTSGAGNGCHEVTFNGNAASVLSPPDSGTYKGMLLWIDSNCGNPPQSSAQATGLTLTGNGNINTSGAIYIPNGTVQMSGSNAVLNASQVIAEKIDQQNGVITMNYDNTTTYQGKIPALVN